MARRGNGWLAGGLVLVAATVATGCDDGGGSSKVRESTTTSTSSSSSMPPTPSSAPVPTLPAPSGALGEGIPVEPPDGFEPARTQEGLEGDITLEDLRAALGDDAVQLFLDAGYQRGVGRGWTRGAASLVELRLAVQVELGSEEQARALLRPDVFGAPGEAVVTGTNPLRATYTQEFGPQPLEAYSVLWAAGNRLSWVFAAGGDPTANTAWVEATAVGMGLPADAP